MKKTLIYKTIEVANLLDKPKSAITSEIRRGNLKATKSGREYLIEKKELDRYLNIQTSEEDLKKDLEIEKLKNRIKLYELELKTVRGLINNLNNILNI